MDNNYISKHEKVEKIEKIEKEKFNETVEDIPDASYPLKHRILFKYHYVIIQGIASCSFVAVYMYLLLTRQDIDDNLNIFMGIIIGFYFNSRKK